MQILKVALIVLLLAPFSLSASSDGVWISRMRKGHPRMFFNSDTWQQIEANAHGKAKPYLDGLLKRADSHPVDPKCSETGPVALRKIKTATGSHMTSRLSPIEKVKDWGTQAAECALAWRFTKERRYLEKAKRMLTVSIAAYHEAYRNGRAVGWYSNSRIMGLSAYDWIWEALTPEERRNIIVPFVAHIEEAHPERGKKHIVRRNDATYDKSYYGVRALQWYSGLAAYGDGFCDELAKLHLTEGRREFLQLVDFREKCAGDDGGLGTATPGYSMGMYPYTHFNFFHTHLSAFGENIAAKHPALALFPNWIYWTWIKSPDGPRYSGFGDERHDQNLLPVWALFAHMTQYIHFFREVDPQAARLAAYFRKRAPNRDVGAGHFPLYPFILDLDGYGVEPYTDEELESIPLHARHFEALGQFLLRSGWKEDSTYCTFTAGSKFSHHKQYDENNFTIYKGDFLALDTGSRGYSTDYNLGYYYSQTVAHNCILVHDPDEPITHYWGPKYNGPEGIKSHGGQNGKKPAKVLAFETNGDFTYIASDAAEAYGKKCGECVRQFVHVLPDVFIVYDRVKVPNPEFRKEWLLHSQNEPDIDGRTFRFDSGKARLFGQALLPADVKLEKVGGKGREFWAQGKNWELDLSFQMSCEKLAKEKGRGPYYGAWRMELKPGTAREADRFLNVLTASDVSVPAPPETEHVADEVFDGAAISLPGIVRDGTRGTLKAVFLFKRDGDVGGRVRLLFRPDGAMSQFTVADRALSDTVCPQKGLMLNP